MNLQIDKQYVPILTQLVDKELLGLRQEIKRREGGFYEFNNGSHMMSLRDSVEILEKIANRLNKASKYSKSTKGQI